MGTLSHSLFTRLRAALASVELGVGFHYTTELRKSYHNSKVFSG